MRTLLPLCLAVIACGCSTVAEQPTGPAYEGKTQYTRLAEPKGTHHYTLSAGQSYLKPALKRNPNPIYPPDLIDRALPPVNIEARLSVDTTGRTTAVYISKDDSQAAYRQDFEQSVRKTARQWVFTPLKFTRKVTHANAPATLTITPKPFSMWFKFHFEVVEGKPVTSSRGR